MDERLFYIEKQNIDLNGVDLNGRILDIGGGGEGIIGQLKGEQVIAIDKRKDELEEAKDSKNIKLVMDGKDLKFIDKTFDTTTVFFTMMYMPKADHKVVLEEIHRVLKDNGEVVIWDLVIPDRKENEKDIYVVPLAINIGDKTIETGYGAMWKKQQDLKYYLELIETVGFEISESKDYGDTFFIRAKKI